MSNRYVAELEDESASSNDIESDGRIILNNRDPPGQRSVYIPPGNTFDEAYRLSTFIRYPLDNCVVQQQTLAAAGFYYTGYKDRVKCFSCGRCVEEWRRTDDPSHVGWHDTNCNHAHATDENNVPLFSLSRFRDEAMRSSNVSVLGSVRPSCSRSSCENQRFNRTYSQSRQAHFSAETSNYQTVMPQQRHVTPPPSVIAATRAIEAETEWTRNADTTENGELSHLFPCQNPAHPHMRREEVRVQTFQNNSHSWTAHRLLATTHQLAEAGLFSLGIRDQVKCWYCNGGLQDWQRNDIPWEEHAKWYPTCEFLLKCKGLDFVHGIMAQNRHLRRPAVHSQYPAIAAMAPRSSPQIIDPRDEQIRVDRLVMQEMTSSRHVNLAREMGFEDRYIKIALKRKFTQLRRFFEDSAELVEALTSLPAQSEPLPVSSPIEHSSGGQSLVSELRRLRCEKMCKICHNAEARVVLIPCGHLAVCSSCAATICACPICSNAITETVRSFTA